ncbi:hypothetical protein CFHF_18045 [Caulobacter flavus]|uniref:Restriction endonuclease n=1 Tax=Caulobacter flavus TaxID=1679497 RepID=A0A2N5CQA1_9CAUL|nr:hypothetical protein [Caulobacter flavus]AYV46270.1 hypothetical protein C1707_08380 [Caulobacter flavus]PLR09990.1 hypothetical protein CFHF_18045 [Caulobacter flavus]
MSQAFTTFCHRADKRFHEADCWNRWFGEVARARADFADYLSKEAYWESLGNETASMSVLATAAVRAGLLATTETVCWKHQVDHRKNFRGGRLDLWVADPGFRRAWAFEAKQVNCRPGTREATIADAYANARYDAWDVPEHEGDRFMGLLVVTLPQDGDTAPLHKRLVAFARTAPDFAWEVGGGPRCKPAFIFIGEAIKRPKPSARRQAK